MATNFWKFIELYGTLNLRDREEGFTFWSNNVMLDQIAYWAICTDYDNEKAIEYFINTCKSVGVSEEVAKFDQNAFLAQLSNKLEMSAIEMNNRYFHLDHSSNGALAENFKVRSNPSIQSIKDITTETDRGSSTQSNLGKLLQFICMIDQHRALGDKYPKRTKEHTFSTEIYLNQIVQFVTGNYDLLTGLTNFAEFTKDHFGAEGDSWYFEPRMVIEALASGALRNHGTTEEINKKFFNYDLENVLYFDPEAVLDNDYDIEIKIRPYEFDSGFHVTKCKPSFIM